MSAWLNSFLGELDPEAVTLVATFVGASVAACAVALRGYKKGTASPSTTAQAIAQKSCGAPVIGDALEQIRAELIRQGVETKEMRADLDHVVSMVTRIEDRTRH